MHFCMPQTPKIHLPIALRRALHVSTSYTALLHGIPLASMVPGDGTAVWPKALIAKASLPLVLCWTTEPFERWWTTLQF
jgi:hypothetical protein